MQLLLFFARLFLYFPLQREEKREKAFKVSVTSEAFCGSLRNGGFVPSKVPYDPVFFVQAVRLLWDRTNPGLTSKTVA